MPLPLLNNPSIIGSAGSIYSITNIQEEGGQSATWGIDQVEQIWQGSRLYQNRLRVLTTHAYVGPAAVLSALVGVGVVLGASYVYPLPEISFNSVFPTEQDTGSFIQLINVQQETEDGKQWVVTIGYGPFDIWHELGNTNATFGSFNPLDFPAIVRWQTAKYHRYYPQDINGFPYINTAGDPLENPPEREESTQCLTLILWTPTYSEPFAQSYRDTVNSDAFLGFPPNTVKCKDIDGERFYTSDYGYVWRVKYEFEIRQLVLTDQNGISTTYGWQALVLNAGYRAFGGATGVAGPIAPIVLGGIPVANPVILQPDGTYIAPANFGVVQGLQGLQALYLTFQNFPMSVFANLNIDSSILMDNQ